MRLNQASVYTLIITCLLLTACGFQLRGNYLLSKELQTMYVSSEDKYGELTRILKQHLKVNEINVLNKYQADTPQLNILKDALNRRTLSVFSNGQVAEYELMYTVRYQLIIQGKNTQNFQFELNRDYQDDPNVALAKSRELALLLSEMRTEAANKILRNLASIQL